MAGIYLQRSVFFLVVSGAVTEKTTRKMKLRIRVFLERKIVADVKSVFVKLVAQWYSSPTRTYLNHISSSSYPMHFRL